MLEIRQVVAEDLSNFRGPNSLKYVHAPFHDRARYRYVYI